MSKKTFPLFILLSSTSTLVCCVLPALFVTFGFGATFASLVTNIPQLVWLSENKAALFIFAATMLVAGGVMQWRAKDEPCPLDPELARACTKTRRRSLGLYIFSVTVYFIGFGFAYLLPLF